MGEELLILQATMQTMTVCSTLKSGTKKKKFGYQKIFKDIAYLYVSIYGSFIEQKKKRCKHQIVNGGG